MIHSVSVDEYYEMIEKALEFAKLTTVDSNSLSSAQHTLRGIIAFLYDTTPSIEIGELAVLNESTRLLAMRLILGRLTYGRIPAEHPLRPRLEAIYREVAGEILATRKK